ncbi:hypothetical protein [Malacoplasma iowae]|uniref:hypothetical protein n=1 Tax=Malacoplasma iowae TaxID=2116 RepID=UPI003873B63B|nr:hypothetical protein QX179_02045 [Malacoplasma iowae]
MSIEHYVIIRNYIIIINYNYIVKLNYITIKKLRNYKSNQKFNFQNESALGPKTTYLIDMSTFIFSGFKTLYFAL